MEQIPVRVAGLSSSPSTLGSFALVLAEAHGNRRLPIIIGNSEAQSIAIELEKIKSARPLTHDLFILLLEKLTVSIRKVVVDDLKDGVFFAKIYLDTTSGLSILDSRPSDAIALAVRAKCDIFVMDHVLNEAGIEVQEDEPASDPDKGQEEEESPDSLPDLPGLEPEEADEPVTPPASELDRLQTELSKAIADEDYERAARLRDSINRLRGGS
ncbi:MAG: bifunctional nuclease family protein [Bacteroidetes bacterium]|nr:bifunctional nuclease family protein [Bacteroidota bacterium]